MAKGGRGADRDLKESDGVLVYQKDAGDKWFDSMLSTVGKMPAVKAACTVDPPDKTKSKEAAQDYKFREFAKVNRDDPRLLLESDGVDSLAPFLELVRQRS